jgi:hypothetical protein
VAELNMRQMVFSVPEGGEVLITYPESMTPESILMVEELCAIWFRGLHRRAIQRPRQNDAATEYESWFPGTSLHSVPAKSSEPNGNDVSAPSVDHTKGGE